MTYFADFSRYDYTVPDRPMVNIGWLDPAHAYPRGPVPRQLIDILLRLGAEPRNQMDGSHTCGFCGSFRGTGEIHVTGSDGVRYSAPTLVIHYIFAHEYQPPSPFIEAVLSPASRPNREWRRSAFVLSRAEDRHCTAG